MGDAFLLGAGFSRAICSKMPTMKKLFKALEPLIGEEDGFSREAYDYAAGNVETLLSYYAIPSPSDDHIEVLRKRTVTALLEQAIGSALQFEERASQLDAAGIKLGAKLVDKWMGQKSHVLTANYDTLVENLAGMLDNTQVVALYPITVVPSSAIGGHDPHGTICIHPALKLYKLHGSVSWYKSSDESDSGPIYGHCDFTHIDSPYQKRIGDKRRFIVPPLPDKSTLLNHESMRNLWWQAKHYALVDQHS